MRTDDLRSQSVMTVDKGETMVGMWATPKIPGTGVYKLAAKKRADGLIEWVQFEHSIDDSRKVLFRGDVESADTLSVLLEITNKQIQRIYGVTLSVADVGIKMHDGGSAAHRVH